jgi:hypothetical protein
MRHWHVKNCEGESCFVITADLGHPRDCGYPASEGLTAMRMARAPGAFCTVENGVIIRDSSDLRSAQQPALQTRFDVLEAMMKERFNAATTQGSSDA